jgi:hypothetical protein
MKKSILKPAPSLEEVAEMLIESMRDHDTGWAYVTDQYDSTIEFVIPRYNTVQKKYKITIEEL